MISCQSLWLPGEVKAGFPVQTEHMKEAQLDTSLNLKKYNQPCVAQNIPSISTIADKHLYSSSFTTVEEKEHI